MKRTLWLIALVLLAAGPLTAEESALPQDVQDYIQDRIGCNHLAGEDYSEPNRAQAMAKELRECGVADLYGVPVSTSSVVTIDTEEKRLRKKYKKQPTILHAMDVARDQLP